MGLIVNADESSATQAQIAATMEKNLGLALTMISKGSLVELDCTGLTYCSVGGTGMTQLAINSGPYVGSTIPFPSAMLDKTTGFGELVGPATPTGLIGSDRGFSFQPTAPASQIGSGNVITEVVTSGGSTTATPATIDFVFETVPAVASYRDTGGGSLAITYPDVSQVGSMSNPLRFAVGANGDVVVGFTAYRPQRAGVVGAGEAAFRDIGSLSYAIDVPHASANGSTPGGGVSSCPASSHSGLSPTLAFGTGMDTTAGNSTNRMLDAQSDPHASSTDAFSFTLDVTKCLQSVGWTSWPVGQELLLGLDANTFASLDHVYQGFNVVGNSR